jgi:flagellar biosynthesis anti-sigma factor FlgM
MDFQNGISQLNQILTSNNVQGAAAPKAQELKGSGSTFGNPGTAADTDGDVDQASFSMVGGLVAKALQVSDVRTEKVNSIQQALSNGAYNVSSSDVAEKLMSVMVK